MFKIIRKILAMALILYIGNIIYEKEYEKELKEAVEISNNYTKNQDRYNNILHGFGFDRKSEEEFFNEETGITVEITSCKNLKGPELYDELRIRKLYSEEDFDDFLNSSFELIKNLIGTDISSERKKINIKKDDFFNHPEIVHYMYLVGDDYLNFYIDDSDIEQMEMVFYLTSYKCLKLR